MPDLDPDPSTLEELLTWVRARAQEEDVPLSPPEVMGRDFRWIEDTLARRASKVAAFREVEHLLVVLLERFGRKEPE